MNEPVLRPYRAEDRAACLAIFDTNVPAFFAADEQEGFASFLDRSAADYLVLSVTDGAIVGCGGVRLRDGGRTAVLRWGMIDARLHRRGLGRLLTLGRLRLALARPDVERVVLYTTGQVAGFYRALGFHDTALLPDHYGVGLDQHTMEAATDEDFRRRVVAR